VGLEQLILDCQKDDVRAQEQLYKLFAAKFFGICLKYAANYAEAEDNLQDGFIIIFKKIGQFNFKGSFEGWAKRIMINNALQKYRNIRFLEIVDYDVADEETIIEEEQVPLEYLLKIIQELPDRYRLVFSLYVLDGYSHKETAEMLGITTGTTKSNLARARMILKDKIDTYTGKKIVPKANER
jgi:RNA polymerase sigma-70 factor (ECF subfamily)